MHFECNNGIADEDGCRLENKPYSLCGSKASLLEGVKTWNDLLWTYGDRKLTIKATNKLPAMSGLAKLFAKQLRVGYVAGLWSNDLIEGLAWQSIRPMKLLSGLGGGYNGPSLSWANYDGITATGVRNGGFTYVAGIKDWYVNMKTDASPYGEVESAWILSEHL
jgi:hypothetical protein